MPCLGRKAANKTRSQNQLKFQQRASEMTTNGMFIYQDGMYSITVFKHFKFKKQFSLIIEIIF